MAVTATVASVLLALSSSPSLSSTLQTSSILPEFLPLQTAIFLIVYQELTESSRAASFWIPELFSSFLMTAVIVSQIAFSIWNLDAETHCGTKRSGLLFELKTHFVNVAEVSSSTAALSQQSRKPGAWSCGLLLYNKERICLAVCRKNALQSRPMKTCLF